MKRLYQMVPIARPRDAVGRMALGLDAMGRARGWRTLLFTERQASPRIGPWALGSLRRGLLETSPAWGGAPPPDVSLYHHSIGTVVADRFLEWPAEKKVLLYHNITPGPERDRVWGREQLERLVRESHVQIALSEYSCRELGELGASNVRRLPYLIWRRPFARRKREPLVIIVGRVERHKRVREAIEAFRALRVPGARMEIVGSLKGAPEYVAELRRLVAADGLRVKLRGRISDLGLQRLYERAGVLLTLSEHEGFCVPIAEAILAGLPVAAFAAGAIPETLGTGGELLHDRDPQRVAEALTRLLSDDATRARIAEAQRAEAPRFSPRIFMDALERSVE